MLIFARVFLGLQILFICILVSRSWLDKNGDISKQIGDYFQAFHGELNLSWA
jgi:hypothetical protein